MFLIRNVFRLKFGKTREALAAWKDILDYSSTIGLDRGSTRVLTDLVGPYYTLILEMTVSSLAEYEEQAKRTMADEGWRTRYQAFTPLVDSGYREIFTIVR